SFPSPRSLVRRSPPSGEGGCGERARVRGCLREYDESWTRGESPSPGLHLAMQSGLSPPAGRGEERTSLAILLLRPVIPECRVTLVELRLHASAVAAEG